MNIRQFNRIVEIRTKIISMGTFLTGYLYGYLQCSEFSLSRFLLTAAAVLCVDMGTTGFNTFFDFIGGTDRKERNFEEDKVLVHEGVSPLSALIISALLFFTAAILGLIIAGMSSFLLIPVGAICMLIGFLYTGGPLPISRTPFGELFAGGFLGTILFMISAYISSRELRMEYFFASLPHLIFVAMILTVNNTCDRESDLKAGRKTLTICLPERAGTALLTVQIAAGYIATVILALIGILPVWSLITSLPAVLFSGRIFWRMRKRGFSLETKGASMKGVSGMFLLYIISYAAALTLQLSFPLHWQI